jgi:hypothetical protein
MNVLFCVCVCVCVCVHVCVCVWMCTGCGRGRAHGCGCVYVRVCEVLQSSIAVFFLGIYRVSQEECARLRENVPNVKVHRYNLKHPYPKLNGYGEWR